MDMIHKYEFMDIIYDMTFKYSNKYKKNARTQIILPLEMNLMLVQIL